MVRVKMSVITPKQKYWHRFHISIDIKYNPTKVTPGDLRRRRPTDFTVKPSGTPLNHFQNVQLASKEWFNGGDDFEFTT